MTRKQTFSAIGLAALLGCGLRGAPPAAAHCDTMDGPVVSSARTALEKGDVRPVLAWVKPDHEKEVRAVFQQAAAVRKTGPEAKALADRFFFETVVRLHREGEGEPYTGLKPSGTAVNPAVVLADKALEASSVETLVKQATSHVTEGIRRRYDRVIEARKRAGESVEAGRRYVAAYVEFTHYMENLHAAAGGQGGHAGHGSAGEGASSAGHAESAAAHTAGSAAHTAGSAAHTAGSASHAETSSEHAAE